MLQRLSLTIMVAACLIFWSGGAETPDGSSIRVQVEARMREHRGLSKHSWYYVGGFQPNYIEVQQGQRVTIELVALEGTHSLSIPDLGVRTSDVAAGQSTEVTFVADRAGEFEIKCDTVCGKFHRRMSGTLFVNEPEEP